MGIDATKDANEEEIDQEKIYIIWIDANVDNEENKEYLNSLKDIQNTKIRCFKNVGDSLTFIKRIKFAETNIIVSGRLYSEFIKTFEENLNDIFIIPKIIVFTGSKKKFLEFSKNYDEKKKNNFYSLGGIKPLLEKLSNF